MEKLQSQSTFLNMNSATSSTDHKFISGKVIALSYNNIPFIFFGPASSKQSIETASKLANLKSFQALIKVRMNLNKLPQFDIVEIDSKYFFEKPYIYLDELVATTENSSNQLTEIMYEKINNTIHAIIYTDNDPDLQDAISASMIEIDSIIKVFIPQHKDVNFELEIQLYNIANGNL